jgi:hypothetical protein
MRTILLEPLLALTALTLGAVSCRRAEKPLFEVLAPTETGITFVNELPEDTAFNILNYLYYYNGAGVAAGDVNNDGLPDLYFSSNLGSNRLYLNKGNYRFEDVTVRAGVAHPEGWKSGVTMADVNADGHLDIYASVVSYLALRGRNALYINNGDGTFSDRTKEFGLEHVGYSTQAAFFDSDGDGDLDMYLLNSSVHAERRASLQPLRQHRHPRAGDRFFRNDGGRFVDISERAGIYGGVEGYGLGVVASDLNLDGCIDLYVANDFQENDFLYYNNCDGTFTESVASAMGHTSRFSMGVDAADFNNDARPDLSVLDMLPEREDILKRSAHVEGYDVFEHKLRAGYHPQYARNTLQLNRGSGLFSEIGYLAGVAATDWSWAPLFADLDNDGLKDLFITNGIFRRPNDLDYIDLVGNPVIQESLEKGITDDNLRLLQRMPTVPLPNQAVRNNGDLTFTNYAVTWGLDQPGFSNGAVYVDLNNSGALDLVVSNVNAPPSIYRNRAREVNRHHYLRVQLRGAGGNTAGVGAKVVIKHGGTTQLLEQMPTRGFQSSVDPRLHFGLGNSDRIDSLTVTWPDRRSQTVTSVEVDRTLALSQSDAVVVPRGGPASRPSPERSPLFTDVTRLLGITFTHQENPFFDYEREPLIPHLLSTEGPALAIGDVNGDSLDDMYVGGARGQAGRLFVQQRDGRFRDATPTARALTADRLREDVDAAFFDADGDGDQDLYVVSGGNEFVGKHEALRDRLYVNDGRGSFSHSRDALPASFENGSCVVPADFDGDGDIDLFVGSRAVAGAYGLSPRSYLLENDGTGRFVDVTPDKAETLANVGMVTSAAWLDVDGDRRLDLIVVGEWMPLRVFRQQGGGFVDHTAEAGLAGTNGWWQHVRVADVNADGQQDLVLGNLGLNSYIRGSASESARLYVHDFDQNGSLDQILTFYKRGVSYPIAGRDELAHAIGPLRARYRTYASFGASQIQHVFPPSLLAQATVLEASEFASSVALNKGDGTFTLHPLPIEAQFAPIYASVADDFDGDGDVDLIVAGNFHGAPPLRGRYDASYGLLLRGTRGGQFVPVDMEQSSLVIHGQVRDTKMLRHTSGRLIVIARNNANLLILRPNAFVELHTPSAPRAAR